MVFTFHIPIEGGFETVSVEPGSSVFFVGANGSGKTRLAVTIEERLADNAHRVSAHRALILTPQVAKISEEKALRALRYGNERENLDVRHRHNQRWQNEAATHLLSDYDRLLQALFAEQTNTALRTHKKLLAGEDEAVVPTKFNRLQAIWERLLPGRALNITGDDITVTAANVEGLYSASNLSDGERAIFYLIGQALVALEDSVLVVDEPELHIHPAIVGKLWDELEAARPDCAFVFVTHDLAFAALRNGQKYVVRDYDPAPKWTIEPVPQDTGFSEETATLILGSRTPILFVEGTSASLDLAIYRCCYPDWTIIPRGSCEEVIHSVVTMRANAALTRVTCAGLVDSDSLANEDRERLQALGVASLPVSEIENLLLLPNVSQAVAATEHFDEPEAQERLSALEDEIFATLDTAEKIEAVAVRHAKRRIDSALKRVNLGDATTSEQLVEQFNASMTSIDVGTIVSDVSASISSAVQQRRLPDLLALYDNKGLLAFAARRLKNQRRSDFESWITRALRNDNSPSIVEAISEHLPVLRPQ